MAIRENGEGGFDFDPAVGRRSVLLGGSDWGRNCRALVRPRAMELHRGVAAWRNMRVARATMP